MSEAAETMGGADGQAGQTRPFEADVSRLLHMMVHSVYSDKQVFLRELISNAADACEKLRFEAIAAPELLGDDAKARITITLDAEANALSVEDNGIGMDAGEMAEALGTIARSGTRAFLERAEAAQGAGAQLIGQFGIGFYSAFMVASRVDVFSRRAGGAEGFHWSSDGKGEYAIAPTDAAPARGTRVVLHLVPDAKTYAERWTVERIVKAQSGHVPVPVFLKEKPDAEPQEIADGAALWTKGRADVSKEDYTDFYRSTAGQYDEPALTVHFRAEGRHEYTALVFVPGSKPFDLFDPDRKGHVKLYVRRVFITDDADLLPRWLRFVRGIVDSSDLPLNVSREMIQESPILAAVKKGVANRVLKELEKLAESDAEAFTKVWENFGPVLKEGIYEDWERREQLLALARFRSTASDGVWRSVKDYVGAMKPGQEAIYYLAGDDGARLRGSPQLEGFRARGIEVLLLSDPVDSFWAANAPAFEGKSFKSVTQGAADLAAVPLADAGGKPAEASAEVSGFVAFVKAALGEAVADVRTSDRLTESAVCLVAPENGPDRGIERILAAAGRLDETAKPILEINPAHPLVVSLAASGDEAFRQDAAHLLYDEARILDGERPTDAKAFSQRLARVMAKGLGA